eukprot:TRINITY_DN4430_c0_g3_i2.p1 TRINITY_DN4430_c0_g3~~TRINITY_DN4430_c0_g3_i2.p1  ORF type:complete len:381 (-),score=75.31 TRINITY_DN4430_c0_g3_i2:299-1372(-)
MGCTSSKAAKAKVPVASDANLQSELTGPAYSEKVAPARQAAPAKATDSAIVEAETKVDKRKAAKDPVAADAQSNPIVADKERRADNASTAAADAGAKETWPQLVASMEPPASTTDDRYGESYIVNYGSVAAPSMQGLPAPAESLCSFLCCAFDVPAASVAAPTKASPRLAVAASDTKKQESAAAEGVKVDKRKEAKDPVVAVVQDNPVVAGKERRAGNAPETGASVGLEETQPQLAAKTKIPASVPDDQNKDINAPHEFLALPVKASSDPAIASGATKQERAVAEDAKVDKRKVATDPVVVETQSNPAVAGKERRADKAPTTTVDAGAGETEPQLAAKAATPASVPVDEYIGLYVVY